MARTKDFKGFFLPFYIFTFKKYSLHVKFFLYTKPITCKKYEKLHYYTFDLD